MRAPLAAALLAAALLAAASPAVLPARLLAAQPADATPDIHARMDDERITYTVNADKTYVVTDARDDTLLTARGLRLRDRATYSFYPETQSVQVVEAWTTEPDGERVPVTDANIFTRPSEAAQNAPGFTDSLTTTVLFPRLREGAHTHVLWRLEQRKPALMGFNTWDDTPVEEQTGRQTVTIDAPAAMDLHWDTSGYAVTETVADGRRRIVAFVSNVMPGERERDMVAWNDVRPRFVTSTFDDLRQLGALYARESADRAKPTPAIAARARAIAGSRTGLDATRAIYDWVARSIRYVAVYLDPQAGWVPHSAEDVLAQGYGDCKDHVVLMQAMLAALGIRADAALVDWGDRFRPPAIASPFVFNHAILYLPDYHRFLNPTDPFATFDAADRGLAGKPVVIATPDGATGRTPPSDAMQNTYRYRADLALDADGTIHGHATIAVAPTIDSPLRRGIALAASRTELAERMLAATPEGGFGTITTSDPRDLDTPLTLQATWDSPHGVALSGSSPHFTIPDGIDFRRVSSLREWLAPGHDRRYPMVAGALDFEWCYALRLPRGRTLSDVPDAIELTNSAGSYAAQYELSGDELRVVRRLVVADNVYQPDAYPALEALIYAALDDSRTVFTIMQRQASN